MPTAPTSDGSSAIEHRHAKLAEFVAAHAIRRGTFTLASGKTASYYCDAKQVTFSPEGAALVADAILEEIADLDLDALGGMDMGATPIVSAVALRSHQIGRPIPTFIVRKEVKEHGTKRRFEGIVPDPPARLVMVDDVITTGGSLIKAIDAVREAGHTVVCAMCILDREEGGGDTLREMGIPFRPLVRASELGLR